MYEGAQTLMKVNLDNQAMKTDPAQVQDIAYRDIAPTLPPVPPSAHFMLTHPAHLMAMGFGSGLSPKAPGTMGTLWAWTVFILIQHYLTDWQWAVLMVFCVLIGWWVCTITARNMHANDPASVVWDEISAFWLVLWLISPAEGWEQLAAFLLFRFFDAVKPGPVGWADRLYHRVDPTKDPLAWQKAGWGIMLDDMVAAFCTLLVIAFWRMM